MTESDFKTVLTVNIFVHFSPSYTYKYLVSEICIVDHRLEILTRLIRDHASFFC